MLKHLNKKSIKLICIFFCFIIGAVVVLGISYYMDPQVQKDREAREFLDEQKEKYENDTYGGETPEETLNFFIEALEDGDVELASKYFVIDRQEEQKDILDVYKNEGSFSEMIKEGRKLKKTKQENDWAFFSLENDNSVMVIFHKNSKGQWKISEL